MDRMTELAQKTFTADRYATEVSGVEVTLLERDEMTRGGHAICTMEIRPMHQNARGSVMGGALFTLADLAFAAASNVEHIAQTDELHWVSTSSTIHYLSGATEGRLTAEARCVKQGRSTCLYSIRVTDSRERLIATVETAGMRV